MTAAAAEQHASKGDPRFTDPLLTAAQTGLHLQIPPTTVRYWLKQRIVHKVEPEFWHGPTMPLISVAETQVLRALRKAGMSMREVKYSADRVRERFGPYGLVQQRIATDGAALFVDFAGEGGAPEWVRPTDWQGALPRLLDEHLQYVEFAEDGYPLRVRLRSYAQQHADVIIDPRFGFGEPVFSRTKVGVRHVVSAFLAGERPEDVAEDFDLTEDEVLAAIRIGLRRAGIAA